MRPGHQPRSRRAETVVPATSRDAALKRRKETKMGAVIDFLGNEITHGASVVYAVRHGSRVLLRKGTVISVSPRLRVRVTLEGKARIVWVRDPQRTVVVR